jgi:hypothetical protein
MKDDLVEVLELNIEFTKNKNLLVEGKRMNVHYGKILTAISQVRFHVVYYMCIYMSMYLCMFVYVKICMSVHYEKILSAINQVIFRYVYFICSFVSLYVRK